MSTQTATPSEVSAGRSPIRQVLHGSIDRFGRWYLRRVQRRNRSIDGGLDSSLRAAARLYARHELPGHIQILEALLIHQPDLWRNARTAMCRGSWHGYTLRLDLSSFYERWAYFLSRYHEVPLQMVLCQALRAGDTFIDGGANNGLVSLVGAWLVGPRGRVVAFEPNPIVYDRLLWHINTNRLQQVIPIRAGLSDEAGELTLQVPGDGNLGAGTFADLPGRYEGKVASQCTAPVLIGDQSQEVSSAPGEMVIKLDVEGFECRALLGLKGTIAKRCPLIIAEANEEMLTQAGSSIREMRSIMEDYGYLGYAMTTARAIIRHRRLILTPITDWAQPPQDVCWILPGSEHAARLANCIRP